MFILNKTAQQSSYLVSSGVQDPYTGFTIRTTATARKQIREMINMGMIPKYRDKGLDNEEASKALAEIYILSVPSSGESDTKGGDVHYFPSKRTNHLIEIRTAFHSKYKTFFTVMRGGFADIIHMSEKRYQVKKTRSRHFFKSKQKYSHIQH